MDKTLSVAGLACSTLLLLLIKIVAANWVLVYHLPGTILRHSQISAFNHDNIPLRYILLSAPVSVEETEAQRT